MHSLIKSVSCHHEGSVQFHFCPLQKLIQMLGGKGHPWYGVIYMNSMRKQMSDTDRCPGCCSILKRSWGWVQLSQSPGLKQRGQAHLVRFTSWSLSAGTLAQGMLLQASLRSADPSASTSACSCSLPLSLCGKRTLFWGQQKGFHVFLCVCSRDRHSPITASWCSPIATQWQWCANDCPHWQSRHVLCGPGKHWVPTCLQRQKI